jgi:hypothetical protein
MGDIGPATRRRGISLVRPKLHEDTQENRGLFRRWTKLHTRDVLSIPKDVDLGGTSKLLRYKRSENGGEEYLYTIHFDDIKLLTTVPFQNVSRRLDLENTRPLGPGGEAVLQTGDERQGTEPMVSSIVGPTSGMFEVVDECEFSALSELTFWVADMPRLKPNLLLTMTIPHIKTSQLNSR